MLKERKFDYVLSNYRGDLKGKLFEEYDAETAHALWLLILDGRSLNEAIRTFNDGVVIYDNVEDFTVDLPYWRELWVPEDTLSTIQLFEDYDNGNYAGFDPDLCSLVIDDGVKWIISYV